MYKHVLGMKLLCYFVGFAFAILGASCFLEPLVWVVVLGHTAGTWTYGIASGVWVFIVAVMLVSAMSLNPKHPDGKHETA